jgi:endonuclease III
VIRGSPGRRRADGLAAEPLAARRARAGKILTRLARAYPDATIELRYRNPLELLAATILSAQCTDERVNMVTESLFRRYRRAEDWANADLTTLEREIHSTGFYKAKARALTRMGRVLVERHRGKVPRTLAQLTALPGVGRKTANVVLGNAFGVPALAVDTHVARVGQRLGLTAATDPEKIHEDLCAVIPRARWTTATHLLIAHGRRTCHARRPECPGCPVRALCPWPGRVAGPEPASARAALGRLAAPRVEPGSQAGSGKAARRRAVDRGSSRPVA